MKFEQKDKTFSKFSFVEQVRLESMIEDFPTTLETIEGYSNRLEFRNTIADESDRLLIESYFRYKKEENLGKIKIETGKDCNVDFYIYPCRCVGWDCEEWGENLIRPFAENLKNIAKERQLEEELSNKFEQDKELAKEKYLSFPEERQLDIYQRYFKNYQEENNINAKGSYFFSVFLDSIIKESVLSQIYGDIVKGIIL